MTVVPGPLAAPADPERLALLVAFALVFTPVVLAGLVADPETRRYFRLRYGVSTGGVALAVVGGVGTFLGLAALGSVPQDAAGLALPLVGLVVGLAAFAFAATHARTLARLRRAADTKTGDVTDGTVATTGFVEAADPPTSPVSERPAVAWEWQVWAKNRHGTDYEGKRAWDVADSGSGGHVFTIDDGSGPLRVDPAGARLDLRDERRAERPPGDTPGRADDVTDAADGGGERYRFVESALAPGTEVTVLGTVVCGAETTDPPTLAADVGDLLVTTGPRRAAVRRHAVRAGGFALCGLLLVALSLRWLAGAFALSLAP